jgi:hypothetical protein
MSKAELLIVEAIQEIEKMGADVRLTNAQIKLDHAQMLVAEVIDEKIGLKRNIVTNDIPCDNRNRAV